MMKVRTVQGAGKLGMKRQNKFSTPKVGRAWFSVFIIFIFMIMAFIWSYEIKKLD